MYKMFILKQVKGFHCSHLFEKVIVECLKCCWKCLSCIILTWLSRLVPVGHPQRLLDPRDEGERGGPGPLGPRLAAAGPELLLQPQVVDVHLLLLVWK